MVTPESKMEVPPYAASIEWYAGWFSEIRSLNDDRKAVIAANRLCYASPERYTRKGYTRNLTTAYIGGEDLITNPITLSVPVAGGASVLKRFGAENRAAVSLHGRWPHVHLGALEAAYGRSAYYQHIMPGLREILESVSDSYSLAELNTRIHRRLSGFLCTEQGLSLSEKEHAVEARGGEIARTLTTSNSIIDALMKYGPETSLALHYLSQNINF